MRSDTSADCLEYKVKPGLYSELDSLGYSKELHLKKKPKSISDYLRPVITTHIIKRTSFKLSLRFLRSYLLPHCT